jgi:hypothetical protein
MRGMIAAFIKRRKNSNISNTAAGPGYSGNHYERRKKPVASKIAIFFKK